MAAISCSSSPKRSARSLGFTMLSARMRLHSSMDAPCCGHEYRSSDRLPVRRTTGFRLAFQVGENGVRLAQHDVAVLEDGDVILPRYGKHFLALRPKVRDDDVLVGPVSYTHLTLPTSDL